MTAAAVAAEGWDLVVANPPYVESLDDAAAGAATGSREVALVGSGRARAARPRGRSARFVVFEVGDGQAGDVAAMLEELGCGGVTITADLTGPRQRVVEGRLP